MKKEITKLLDDLAEIRAELVLVQQEQERMIDEVMPNEVKQKVQSIRDEFGDKIEIASSKTTALEQKIKDMTIELGETVDGEFLKAVFNNGRITWDNKALDGYAKAHPELLEFRKEGKPYVSIR